MWLRRGALLGGILVVLVLALAVAARLWLRHTADAALPQIDGALTVPGLRAPVTVLRNSHGVPSLRAASLEDLVLAQGYITAQDRLFQLDALRRHAAGELAEVLGPALLEHDRAQRLLQLRAAADRALAALPAGQRHWLDLYTTGVNAAMRRAAPHLPLEFRLLSYTPRPWTPRDSVLIGLVMYQDLTTGFPQKLDREALTRALDPSLAPELRTQLLADLYPVGSWRDHPPSQPGIDLTRPVDAIPDIPLDDSQVERHAPDRLPNGDSAPTPRDRNDSAAAAAADLAHLREALSLPACADCRAGSNNWVVSGAYTQSGAPLLANDMHLSLTVPGLWYQVDLTAPLPGAPEPFHVAGVSLPGTPFVIVGRNAHVAWGFTNLGADVQDVLIEHLRGGAAPTEYRALDGTWHPLLHQTEIIRVRGARPLQLDVVATEHGGEAAPILSPLLRSEHRALALRWTIYNAANVSLPFFDVGRARSAAELVEAFAHFGGPAQNLVYADDAGHIGYHAVGRIPVRGSPAAPQATTDLPLDTAAPGALAHEWAGYIPYDQLPQVADPPNGLLATANARITPDGYPFPITSNWADPYRNERIWRLLTGRRGLTPDDMLRIQIDIFSEPDRLIARRLAYAIDHARHASPRQREAADLLRSWDGVLSTNSPAAAITSAARAALWPLLLTPKLTAAPHTDITAASQRTHAAPQPWQLYSWGERAYAEEQLIAHAPARWLPTGYPTWDDLLAAAVDQGLAASDAPRHLAKWRYGAAHPVELEHPVFAQSRLLRALIGLRTGTGAQPQSGDGTTMKQVGRTFGPSERFTADLADPDQSTLNLVLGESGNPASPWFLDQFPAWLHGTTLPMPFSEAAVAHASQHTLTLSPAGSAQTP